VLGAKYQMKQEIAASVRHFLSPLRGWIVWVS
jgi:hypothetical protein